MRTIVETKYPLLMCCGLWLLSAPLNTIAGTPEDRVESRVEERNDPVAPADSSVTAVAPDAVAESADIPADAADDTPPADASETNAPADEAAADIDIGDIGEGGDLSEPEAPGESPLRISAAYEFGYKLQHPGRSLKNRASLRVEYARTFDGRFSVQFDAKANAFLGHDHRREAERHDVMLSQANVQTSIGGTSLRAGIQTLPWGESILAPITDEISPRDNRELFNFNLEELRIGQPMVAVDHYAGADRWSAFVVPKPYFNETPADGTLYDFDPLRYRGGEAGDGGAEYGLSWKRNFDKADITLMAASLVDNDYARRLNADGTATRVRMRIGMTGLVFTRALGDFVLRGEAALKSGKPFNDPAMRIVTRRTVEAYVGLDYRPSPTLSLSAGAVNVHIADWNSGLLGTVRDRRTGLFSVQKNFMNDDLSVTLQTLGFWPNHGSVSLLLASWKVDDNLTLSMNLAVPTTDAPAASLWPVRDQKQASFKVQWQF
jgi:hypothetical protein